MATQNFIDRVTPIQANWLNDVNTLVYDQQINIAIEPYSASPGSTISTKLNNAIAALSGTGGTVYVPQGVYTLDAQVTVPPKVNIIGAGLNATVFQSSTSNGRLFFSSGGNDGRGGLSGNFTIDGNNVGTDLLKLAVVVERTFQSIEIWNSAGTGLLLEGAQNNTFLNVASQNNSGSNIVIDLGAGNNRFLSCEVSRAGGYNIVFQQSGTSPVGAFQEPSGNRFIGCVVERLGWSGGTLAAPDTGLGTILHTAGRYNGFHQCDIALQGLGATKTMVTVSKTTSYPSILLEFTDILWSGSPNYTTAIEVQDNCSVVLNGRQTFENHLNVFRLADTSSVTGVFVPSLGTVTNYFVNYGSGVQPQQNLLVAELRQRLSFAVPAGHVGVALRADSDVYASTEIFPGNVKFGTGGSAVQNEIKYADRYGISGLALDGVSSPSQFVTKLGPIDLLILNSVPTQAAPNGSLAVNTAGGASVLYVRQSGAWVLK